MFEAILQTLLGVFSTTVIVGLILLAPVISAALIVSILALLNIGMDSKDDDKTGND